MKLHKRHNARQNGSLKKQQVIPADGPVLGPTHRPIALTETVVDAIDEVESHLVSLHTPTAFETEQYHMLGHQVEQMHRDRGLSVVAVSSPAMGDGKTTTVINLAGVLGQPPGLRVLLLETDLCRPMVEAFLGLEHARTRNLVDAVLNPDYALKDVVTWCVPFNFAVLPAGHPLASYHELLASPQLGELLQEARRCYDFVLVDTPPLLPFSDCRVIGKWVDGFLVVVNAHQTPRQQLEQALNVVEPSKMIGLLFNQDANTTQHAYADYYRTPALPAGQIR